MQQDENQQKGEMVILLGPIPKVEINIEEGENKKSEELPDTTRKWLSVLLAHMSVKSAATVVHQATGISRQRAYQDALDLKKDS